MASIDKFMPKFGILAKVLISFLILAILPLILLGALSLQGITEIGSKAVEDSRRSLDEKSAEGIQTRVIDLSVEIADFLKNCEQDLHTLSLLPRDSGTYLEFSRAKQREVWTSIVSPSGVREARIMKPLFREIAFISPNGKELIKIVNDRIAPADRLRDVSDPRNTRYKSETYFADTINRGRNDIFVSHVTGFYVTKYEVLGDSLRVMDNPGGKRFEGVVRFAKKIYDNGELLGIVTIAMDHIHLMEFTDHITPTAPANNPYVFAVDDTKGNETYMVDDEGWVISHTRDWMIRGVNPLLTSLGEPMPPAVAASHIEDHFLSRPVQLDKVDFMDFLRDIAKVPALAANGKPDMLWYHWSGHQSFLAYAPIPYYGGDYREPLGFGWVGITADVNTFHEAANMTATVIRESQRKIASVTVIIIVISMIIVFIVAMWLARSITQPIIRLTELANRISMGDLGLKIDVKSSDEIGALSDSISRLAISLQAAMKRLSRR